MSTHPSNPLNQLNHAAEVPVLSHVRESGVSQMVDVGDKAVTARSASAEGYVRISPALAMAIRENTVKKGSVLEVARLAGILAAKRTDELIPLCHTLPLEAVDITILQETERIRVEATVRTSSKTGVEMEALTAVTVACLTIVDMGKAIDKSMVIEGVRVTRKIGGRSGSYYATANEEMSHSKEDTKIGPNA